MSFSNIIDEFSVCGMCNNATNLSNIFGHVECKHFGRLTKTRRDCRFCAQKTDVEPGLYSLVRDVGKNETVEVYHEVTANGTHVRARHDSQYVGLKVNDLPIGQYLKPLWFMASG